MTTGTLSNPQKTIPLLFEGLTWREFKAVEQLLDRPGYRLSFLDGVLEIVPIPSEAHETVKERIAALLELYLLMAGVDFTPTGSMTLESETGQVKREADKSYKLTAGKLRPDLAIEVVFSSGGINKLEAYRRLNISEVWFWEDGVLEIYHLRNDGDQPEYEQIDQSEAIPGIDLALLLRCISLTNHVDAVRTWQQSIQ
ncbi:Uma2 family endonuclease [Acaryochloris sp. CCMEE 5410]|uniref:Uma2 family endonuclease n=1 Tax=Acaryochloris sp. CCMEE 5410 TaxID=310037 RepID=UPI00024852F6|nr:Uma2 family endonuclease [Acaryochloris sp. CCMEE 5410]KAI9131132.1 Uma2 family endonuclease [Acaryochloris sp. CCMEE 5410]